VEVASSFGGTHNTLRGDRFRERIGPRGEKPALRNLQSCLTRGKRSRKSSKKRGRKGRGAEKTNRAEKTIRVPKEEEGGFRKLLLEEGGPVIQFQNPSEKPD